MASPLDEFTLESVRDYMLSRDGRVTNHELVKHFKIFLTDPACKELSRNKFKQYVNTLANISQEEGEKYLVLKTKYRTGTRLSESEFLAHQNSQLGPRFASPSQYNLFGSPPLGGGYSPQYNTSPPPVPPPPYRATPPYRAPPPYRPPPPATPTSHGYQSPDDQYSDRRYDPPPQHYSGRQQGGGGDARYYGEPPRYPPPGTDPRYPPSPPSADTRYNEVRCSYDEPADLGIPPPPHLRNPGSLNCNAGAIPPYGGSPGPHAPSPNHAPFGGFNNQPLPLTPLGASRPKSLPLCGVNLSLASPSEDGDSISGGDELASATTLSATTTGSSVSTPSSEEPPPPIPPRKRSGENKENRRPSPEGEEGNRINVMGNCGDADVMDNGGGGGETPLSASEEDQRKVSVKETTQKFNRLASESLLMPSSRASSKSNRNSRSDRDDDDSSSIHSQYGPEGQEWIVAAAKSDFNEILRLLKIHPTLAKYKDIANGYTALHWAAKHGRSEVVKLLAGTHHVEINARSNGGYTPLHIAAMYTRTEVFDLLVHYGADLNMRDYSGKKPRTYNTINSTVSHDTQKRIIQRRNSGGYWIWIELASDDEAEDITEEKPISKVAAMKDKVKEAAGFLRIGSLNVKVRKTTEAFNNLLSRDVEARLHRSWGSSDSLPDVERE